MKIAYFNASMNEQQDGVSRCVYRMIAGAIERGHEVIAVSSACPEGAGPVRMVGVPSVVLPLQKGYRLAVPGYCHFTQPVRDFAPDLIHSNSPCTLGFAAIGYARRFGVPIVSTYHTHFPSYARYYNMRRFEDVAWSIMRAHYNGMDRTFVPTAPILDELAAHGIRRLQYMPNGYDSALFNPAASSTEWRRRFGGGDTPILLFLSRLVWEKDLRVLAEAYRALREQGCDFEMVVVGDGPARGEFAQLMPGAHFLGHLSGRALSEAYASSDIFVFPSTSSLRAMRKSSPVLATGGAAGFSAPLREGRNAFARVDFPRTAD